MNHLQKITLSRIAKIKVCTNNIGQGGNEAGIITMNNIDHLTPQEKSELVEASGLHELAFIEKEDLQNYRVNFFNEKQEIAICGHLSLAIAEHLKSNNQDEITLHGSNNLKIGLRYKNNKSYVKIDKPEKGKIRISSDNEFFDLTQNKEIVLRDNIDNIEDNLENRAVLFASQISGNKYKTRFFRDGKEDPFHMSGLVPLAEVLSIKEATFESGNGGEATLVSDQDSYLLTGNCIDLNKQLISRL